MNPAGHPRRRARFAAFLPLLVLALAACNGARATSSDVIRTDSAGVRLITSGARDTVLPWTFKEIDVLRDSLGEPWLFTNLRRANILTDRAGRTYVVTRDPSIVRFGRDGRYERTVGRKGGGSGEYELPTSIGSQGDTVWVRDGMKGALVRFLPDLSPTSDRRLEGALGTSTQIHFRQGGLWFRTRESSDSAVTLAVFADTLGSAALQRVSVKPKRVQFKCADMPWWTELFAPELPIAASEARLLVGASSGYALWLYEGPRALASIRRPLAPRAPTAEDVRALYPTGMEIRIGSGDGVSTCVTPVEEIIAQQGLAPEYPFVFDVALLPDATMWALRTPHGVRPAIVDVFNSEGVYVGSTTGMGLPLAMLPNGELLFARDDEESGGTMIVRMKGTR